METKEQVMHTLLKGLHAEFSAITFYIQHLKDLNYTGNRNALETLTKDSLEHAKLLVEEILKLQGDAGGQLKRATMGEALAEEFSMREIYRFEKERTGSAEVRKLMQHLIEEEQAHERLVSALK